jgi:glycine/D-amino acid oxidase-like deaminating enzyme
MRLEVMQGQLAEGGGRWQGARFGAGRNRLQATVVAGRAHDIDDNRSPWIANKPEYQPRPALTKSDRCDVAIVGGGFTGISTALHLSERFPDRRIVVLEARELANGASGRNGGLMLNWVNGVHSPDAAHAQRIFEVTKSGIDLVMSTIERHRLEVGHRRDGSLEVFTNARRAEEAERHCRELQAAGLPLVWLDRSAIAQRIELEGVHGAVLDPTAGHLDGVDYLRALRPLLLSRGVVVHEHTPVMKIDEGRTVTLHTPGGELEADALVLATNAYTPQLGYFRDAIFPLHSHLVASAPRSEDAWRTMGWHGAAGFSDDLDRIAYGCMTTRGELVFGGGSNAAYSYRFGSRTSFPNPPIGAMRAIEGRLKRYLPRSAEVEIAHRWSGPVALTMSRVCAMGVRGEHRNVYYAFGYSGHGVVLANLAGRILADIYCNDDERWRDLPFYQPRLWPIPPEPLRWLGYHVYTRLTGRSPRRPH